MLGINFAITCRRIYVRKESGQMCYEDAMQDLKRLWQCPENVETWDFSDSAVFHETRKL
jgi:hypothetical protein